MSKILIIDDDEAICELVKISLELAGHNCKYSTDPIKGYALIKQDIPDLIILDVMMGEVDGYSLALKIRQNENTKNIPIIMLTALGELQDKLRGLMRVWMITLQNLLSPKNSKRAYLRFLTVQVLWRSL